MKLKELRKNKHLTQTEMAKNINVPMITYTRYENGEREPSLQVLCKIADYYNVSLDYLCDRKTPYQQELGYLTDEQFKLIQEIKKLNELNIVRAYAYITGLLESQK